jgi:hypothetical protein
MSATTITTAVALDYLAGNRSLEDFTTLDDDAASLLAESDKGLRLDSIQHLTSESARRLACHKGPYLLLGGLSSISDDTVEALSAYGGGLALDGMTHISDYAASALAEHRSPNGPGDPGARHATFGAVARADDFDEGFAIFNVDLEQHMVTYSPGFLLLGGITKLSDKAAEALAQHQGWIDLKGLDSISVRAATAFAARLGPTSLGCSTVSDGVAEELATARGLLNLDFVSQISPESIALLQANNNISLSTVDALYETLTAEGAHEVCDSMAPTAHYTSIDDDAAAILGERYRSKGIFTSFLNFNGLKSLSELAATELVKCDVDLYLCGLTELTLPVATALSSAKAGLHLDGIRELSDEVATALSQHKGSLSLQGLVNISDHVALAFAKHGNVSLDDGQDSQMSDEDDEDWDFDGDDV